MRIGGLRPGVLLLALAIAVFLWGLANGAESIQLGFDHHVCQDRGMNVAAPALLMVALAPALAAQDGDRPPPPDPTLIMSAAEADPTVPRGLLTRTDQAYDGYTLFAPLNAKRVYLIDLDGEIVH